MSKFLEIFRAGKYTDSNGQELEFSDADVEAIAKNYDPKVHEAPIVVGHPKNNAPAFGWIKGLIYNAANSALKAVPSQLNPDFVEAVKAGSYKKISVSLYSPTSPNNPTPGQYSLRHVGFLGAQPPAIKGLSAVEFAEDELTFDAEIDFADVEAAWNDKSVSRILRSLKNFLIAKFTQEEADTAIPEWEIESISTSAEQTIAKENVEKTDAAFAETLPESSSGTDENAELAEEKKKTALLEAELAQIKTEKTASANKEFCDTLIKNGRLLPTQKAKVVAFMNSLENTEIEFSEDDKRGNLDFFKEFLSTLPVQVNFSEVTPAQSKDEPDISDPRVLAEKALEYQEEKAKAGKIITISEAVYHVKG